MFEDLTSWLRPPEHMILPWKAQQWVVVSSKNRYMNVTKVK